jgi:hypothetical protein
MDLFVTSMVILTISFGMLVHSLLKDTEEIEQLKAEKKQMVELLGRVYLDVDQTNGSLYHDTIREIKKWVNG